MRVIVRGPAAVSARVQRSQKPVRLPFHHVPVMLCSRAATCGGGGWLAPESMYSLQLRIALCGGGKLPRDAIASGL